MARLSSHEESLPNTAYLTPSAKAKHTSSQDVGALHQLDLSESPASDVLAGLAPQKLNIPGHITDGEIESGTGLSLGPERRQHAAALHPGEGAAKQFPKVHKAHRMARHASSKLRKAREVTAADTARALLAGLKKVVAGEQSSAAVSPASAAAAAADGHSHTAVHPGHSSGPKAK